MTIRTGNTPALGAESPGPVIPDFQRDAKLVASYNEARLSYEISQTIDAEERTRATFAKRRLALRVELDATGSILFERKMAADKALWAYANRYPLRVVDDTPERPSFWEQLTSWGAAGTMYERITISAAEVAQALARRQRLETDEDDLENQLQRTLYLQDEARRKNLESGDGLAAFHALPEIAGLYAQVVAIEAERADYNARLAAGQVSAAELRDRSFAQQKIAQLEAPCAAVTIVRLARYGNWAYFILRDLIGKLYHLAWDPRLDALIDQVLDVHMLDGQLKVRSTVGPSGLQMTIHQHYDANFRDEAEARDEYRKASAALVAPRTTIVMENPLSLTPTPEQELIELLAAYAGTIRDSDAIPAGFDAEADA